MEQEPTSPLDLEEIKQILASKKWYQLTNKGGFDFHASTKHLAGLLNVPGKANEIKEIFKISFNELAVVNIDNHPLIILLQEIDPNLIVFTEGDPDWQKVKIESLKKISQRGLTAMIYSQNKNRYYGEAMNLAHGEVIGVLDDKPVNLAAAQGFADEFPEKKLITYLINLKDDNFSLEALIEQIKADGVKSLIVDLDGVLIKTDEITTSLIVEELSQLLSSA